METSCGKVTETERDEIKRLHQRKIALNELFIAMGKMDPATVEHIYERALADMGETATKFHSWWDLTAKQYGWTSARDASWRIDFDTCEVFLVRT